MRTLASGPAAPTRRLASVAARASPPLPADAPGDLGARAASAAPAATFDGVSTPGSGAARATTGSTPRTPSLVAARPRRTWPRIDARDGATRLTDRAAFEALAVRDDRPGAAGVFAMKLLIVDVDTPRPRLFFINGNTWSYHADFAQGALGMPGGDSAFNAATYFNDRRQNLAATLVAHDEAVIGRQRGVYTIDLWPTDPVRAPHIAIAWDAIGRAMPFARRGLRYHPAGDTQERLAAADADALRRRGVRVVTTAELFAGVRFSALNPGEGFGVLRVADGPQATPPSVRDVVIFKALPNDLSHVGGILTEVPQTPLSHINLKAKQNHTPNAYVKDASTDPRIAPLIGKTVFFQVTPTGFELREALPAEAEAWLERVRPPQGQTPTRDLTVRDVVDFAQLGHGDTAAFGAKTANVAELRKILPASMVPDGCGVPFSFYDDFMRETGLYDAARAMMAAPGFRTDPAAREAALKGLRKQLKDAPLPPHLAARITALQARFKADQALRCRSSTNNEDLVDFNGAGLYDSYTHRPTEGDLSKTIKQVWASLWNFRAFEEREFYRVDHFAAAMAVAVHPNMDDELVNGVAVTKNIYDPKWPGFYVNAQKGEVLVTNPDATTVPDELLVSAIGQHGEYETQFIRHSSLAENGAPLLSETQLKELVSAMEKIHAHFKRLYGRTHGEGFAMDLEWKITKAGALVVKQARPMVG